jgi:hypothetical protein
MSLDEFLEQKKGKRIYNSSPDIVSGNFEYEKIEHIIFFLRMTQILHIPKTWGNFNKL